MHDLIYVLRSPSEKASSSLYASEDSSLTIDVGRVAQPGIVLSTNTLSSFQSEQALNYKQLLDVLLDARKVITL